MRKLSVFCSLTIFLALGTVVSAQSTFDLEPQLQANPISSEVTMSPDPDALPVFKFATAQLDGKGNIVVATKRARQKLVAPPAASIDPELDPKGIRYTENVTQNYTVMVPYTEKGDDGVVVTKTRTETRTRNVPVTRFRRRNEAEQAKFEKKVAEHEAKVKSGEIKTPKVAPAVSTSVTQEYQVQVPYTVEEDGKNVTRTRAETRTRTLMVLRGKTETTATVNSTKISLEKAQCFGVDGKALDEATLKERLTERQPVVLLNSAKAVSFEYFKQLLHPNAIFVVVKE